MALGPDHDSWQNFTPLSFTEQDRLLAEHTFGLEQDIDVSFNNLDDMSSCGWPSHHVIFELPSLVNEDVADLDIDGLPGHSKTDHGGVTLVTKADNHKFLQLRDASEVNTGLHRDDLPLSSSCPKAKDHGIAPNNPATLLSAEGTSSGAYRRSNEQSSRSSAVKSHCCPEPGCDKSFLYPKDVRRHRLTHQPDNQFYCPYVECDRAVEGFGRKDSLQRHLRNKHGEAASE